MTGKLSSTLAIGCMALFAFHGPVSAQSSERQASPNQFLVNHLQSGATLTRYLQGLHAELMRLDANSNGAIEAVDADLMDIIHAASYRASNTMRFMNADLDGDGAVTEAELRKKLTFERRTFANSSRQPGRGPTVDERLTQEIRWFMAADADNDGRVTWTEAIEFLKKQDEYAQAIRSTTATSARQLLLLAADGATSIPIADIEAAGTAIFAAVDADGNGTISSDELTEARTRVEQARRKFDCSMPAASEQAKVVLVTSYLTDALSSVALGSQDSLTGVGTIVVEPGNQSFYLLIASYEPTIWRFTGAVERIERVVVTTTKNGVGIYDQSAPPWAAVTGLPTDRVAFSRQSGCFSFFTASPSIDGAKASAVVKRQIDRDVEVIAAHHAVASFHVPSGKIDSLEDRRSGVMAKLKSGGFPMTSDAKTPAATGDLERNFLFLTPGGLVEIDPKSVVASTTVEPYEVRPQEAGLIQLMQSGALTQNQRGEFLIHSKIRFPVALDGRHAAKFLLMRGVPMPEGNPGSSLVVSEETGEAIRKPD
jgi:Ca2+-binding EF-hand superfamily protein